MTSDSREGREPMPWGETRPVVLHTMSGPIHTEGEVYGLWAVTPMADTGSEDGVDRDWWNWWNTTHVPSGAAVGGDSYASRADVVDLTKVLGALFSGPEWDVDEEGARNIPADERQRFRRCFRAWLFEQGWDRWKEEAARARAARARAAIARATGGEP